MKKFVIAFAAAFVLFASVPVAYAGDQNPQHVCGTPQKPCGKWVNQKYKTHDEVRFGFYTEPQYATKSVFVKTPCKGQCQKPKKVEECENCSLEVVKTEDVKIPPLKPIIVEVEREIIIVQKPKVIYAPAPNVIVPSPPPVQFQTEVVMAPPAPAPVIHQQPRCAAPKAQTSCNRCKAAAVGVCPYNRNLAGNYPQGNVQQAWQPTVDCNKVGGKRVINPNTGSPSCYVQ